MYRVIGFLRFSLCDLNPIRRHYEGSFRFAPVTKNPIVARNRYELAWEMLEVLWPRLAIGNDYEQTKPSDHMTSNSLKLAVAILAAGFALASAKGQVSGNVAIQSDYVWRGYSQNSADPSIQGGFDFEDESGFYIGLWGASVDFGGPETTEGDIYLGFANEIQESGFEYDVGIIEYTYHGGSGADDSNFTEYYIGGSYAGFGLTYAFGDEFGDNVEASYSYDFEHVTLSAAYGDYEDAWAYWTFGVSGEIEGIGWDISFWDTDLDGDPLADSRVVFTISKSL